MLPRPECAEHGRGGSSASCVGCQLADIATTIDYVHMDMGNREGDEELSRSDRCLAEDIGNLAEAMQHLLVFVAQGRVK